MQKSDSECTFAPEEALRLGKLYGAKAVAPKPKAQAQAGGLNVGAITMRIYLAGPLGFSEAGRAFHEGVIKPGVEVLGHEALDPWTLNDPIEIAAIAGLPYGLEKRDRWRELNERIGRKNTEAIDACDLVFAVLDGTDVDSGTAAEIGYAHARGKTILGYRGDFRLSADNEGSTVNLQVEYFIHASGGWIITAIAELEEVLARLSDRLGETIPSPLAGEGGCEGDG